MRSSPARVLLVSLVCAIALAAVMLASLLFGIEPLDVRAAFADPTSPHATILFVTRLPRVLLGALVGMALAPAGVAFQALLRNPLADPYVLGVSGGASIAGTLAIVFGLSSGMLGAWT